MTSPYDPAGQQPSYAPQQPQRYAPPQPYYQQPQQVVYYQQAPAPYAGPRRAVTRQRMPITLELFHWTLILMSAGLWLPVYLAAKRRRKAVTTFRP